jgi:hypothetical protein
MNSLDKRLNGEILPLTPWIYNWARGKFDLRQEISNGPQIISFNPEKLREWLSKNY